MTFIKVRITNGGVPVRVSITEELVMHMHNMQALDLVSIFKILS